MSWVPGHLPMPSMNRSGSLLPLPLNLLSQINREKVNIPKQNTSRESIKNVCIHNSIGRLRSIGEINMC